MSWLISLLIAGAVFSAENKIPLQTNNYTETKNVSVVKAYETEHFEQTYPLNATGRVSVSNINGSITIEGWDKPEVKLEYVKTADDREALNDIEVKIDAKPDYLRIETDQGKLIRNLRSYGGTRTNYTRSDVAYHLMVPRNAVLNKIEAVNGSVDISNTTNSAKVSAINGNVKAVNLSGVAELSTVNGTVAADYERLDNTNQIRLETVNGRVSLTLPSDANATVRAEATNGIITNDFGLPIRRASYGGSSSLYGKLGNGNVKIKLESVNGKLSLQRRTDGKNPNPVTNLLNSKTDDDGDFDGVLDESTKAAIRQAAKVKVNTPEINTEIQKALMEAQREIAKANINPAEMQKTIAAAMKAQQAAMRSLRDAEWFQGMPSVERKSENFSVRGVPNVVVNGGACSVKVHGWDKPEVQYNFTRISRKPNAEPSSIAVSNNNSQIKIDATEAGNDFFRLELEVFVPRKSNLRISSDDDQVFGGIRVENVSGEIGIEGADSPVNVRGGDGKLNIKGDAGAIRVIGFGGTVEAETGAGTMSFDGDFEKLAARSGSGTIILTLPENADVMIESNNKNINAKGIALVRQNDKNDVSTWKIGSGGKTYSLDTDDDGKIFVRNSDSLKVK